MSRFLILAAALTAIPVEAQAQDVVVMRRAIAAPRPSAPKVAKKSACGTPVANSTVTGAEGFASAGTTTTLALALDICEQHPIKTTACYVDRNTPTKFTVYVMSKGYRIRFPDYIDNFVADCTPQ